MLTLLRIRDLALIEALDLEFGSGLNVLTGETGSGKSIVLTSIGLLLGGRAQPQCVRGGAERAIVEAIVDTAGRPAVREWLKEQGLESAEPNELLLRREVMAGGRSRATINGKLATAGQLAELGQFLVEIHGQNDQQALLQPSSQRDLFDSHGTDAALRLAMAEAYDRYGAARARLEELSREDREWSQRLDFLEYQIEEIEALGLSAEEEEELRQEHERLAHMDALQQGVAQILALLSENPSGEPVAVDQVGQAEQALGHLMTYDQGLAEVAETLSSVAAQLCDVARDLEGYANRLEGDPARLAEIEDRLEAIKRLERKHGAGVEAILERLEQMKAEAESLRNRDSLREEAAAEEKRLGHELLERAARLSRARQQQAEPFARQVVTVLKDLAMPGVRFEVALLPYRDKGVEVDGLDGQPLRVARDGAEQVEFLISTNPGEAVSPLRKIASGGELSRVMLALRTLGAERDSVPVLIFDEVDAGISGRASNSVAAKLAELGCRHQVLCVTHQAAIAARADTHMVVAKEPRAGRTITTVRTLGQEERRRELARLLDGAASEKSLELAREMLAPRV